MKTSWTVTLFAALIGFQAHAEQAATCTVAVQEDHLTASELQGLVAKGYEVQRHPRLHTNSVSLQPQVPQGTFAFYRQPTASNRFVRFFSRETEIRVVFRHRDPLNSSEFYSSRVGLSWAAVPHCDVMQAEMAAFSRRRHYTALIRQGTGENQRSYGETIIGLEALAADRAGVPFDVTPVLRGYRNLRERIAQDLRQQNASLRPENLEAYVVLNNIIHNRAREIGLGTDRQGIQSMSSYFVRGGGDCNSNTLLLLALTADLHIEAPTGFVYGVEVYRDHVAPTLYSARTGQKFDMYAGGQPTPAKSNPIISLDYYLHRLIGVLNPQMLDSESSLALRQGNIPFTDPTGRRAQGRRVLVEEGIMPSLLSLVERPVGSECWIANCEEPPSRSSHPRPAGLDQRLSRDRNETPPEPPPVDRGETCPFITYLALQQTLDAQPRVSMLHVKMARYESTVPRGLNFSLPERTVRNARDVVQCGPTERMAIQYRSYELGDLQRRRANRTNQNADAESDDVIDNLLESLSGEDTPFTTHERNEIRGIRPVLMVPQNECPTESMEDAVEICNLAKSAQIQSINHYARNVYSELELILRQPHPWSDFQRRPTQWARLKEAIDKAPVEIFNLSRAQNTTLRLLSEQGVNFQRILTLAREFREREGQDAFRFFVEFSTAPAESQITYISTLDTMARHLEFLSRYISRADATLFGEVPQFAGGLLEHQLRFLLQNNEFQFIADDANEMRAQLQRVNDDPTLRQHLRPRLPEVRLPQVPGRGVEEACRQSQNGYVQWGSVAFQCPPPQPPKATEEHSEDPRREIKVSALLLPLLMAESEREALRPLNLIFAAYLWRALNDQAVDEHKAHPLLGSRLHQQRAPLYSGEYIFNWKRLLGVRVMSFEPLTFDTNVWQREVVNCESDVCDFGELVARTLGLYTGPQAPPLQRLTTVPTWLMTPLQRFAFQKVKGSHEWAAHSEHIPASPRPEYGSLLNFRERSHWSFHLMRAWGENPQFIEPLLTGERASELNEELQGMLGRGRAARQRQRESRDLEGLLRSLTLERLPVNDTDLLGYPTEIEFVSGLTTGTREEVTYGRSWILERNADGKLLLFPFFHASNERRPLVFFDSHIKIPKANLN